MSLKHAIGAARSRAVQMNGGAAGLKSSSKQVATSRNVRRKSSRCSGRRLTRRCSRRALKRTSVRRACRLSCMSSERAGKSRSALNVRRQRATSNGRIRCSDDLPFPRRAENMLGAECTVASVQKKKSDEKNTLCRNHHGPWHQRRLVSRGLRTMRQRSGRLKTGLQRPSTPGMSMR